MFIIQQKLREEREARRATMDGRHEYLLSTVAERLEMSLEDAEEFMLDGDQVNICRTYYSPPTHMRFNFQLRFVAEGVRLVLLSWGKGSAAVLLSGSTGP